MTETPPRPATTAAVWCAVLVAALWPLLLVDVPDLLDYPTHLARQSVLVNWGASSALRANYAIAWGVKPNLAMDAVVPALSAVMPLAWAGKAFIAMTMLSLVGGTAALSRALHGRVGLAPVAAAAFCYNFNLYLGMLNFLFGSGLALAAFALWVRPPGWPPAARHALFAALAAALFFCHIFAVSAFLLLAGAWEMARLSRAGAAGAALRLFAAAAPVAVLWALRPHGVLEAGGAEWGDLWLRGMLMMSGLYFSGDNPFAMVAAPFGFLMLWLAGRRFPVVRDMWVPLAVVALVAVAMPKRLVGGDVLHSRLPAIFMFLLTAAVPPALLAPRRAARLYLAWALALTASHSYEAWGLWSRADVDIAQYRAASRAIVPGARVMLVLDKDGSGLSYRNAYLHVVDLAAMDRCAFVSSMAKVPDQQPVVAAAAAAAADGGDSNFGVEPELFVKAADPAGAEEVRREHPAHWRRLWFIGWQDKFDYVVHLDWGNHRNLKPGLLERVASGDVFAIYRVKVRPPLPEMSCPARP
jgi:hypothetical protein